VDLAPRSLTPLLAAPALLAALGSCATYAPDPLVPADELARLKSASVASLRLDEAAPRDAGSAPASFDPSDGLDEAELVAVALTLNPALRAKRLEIGESRALLLGAGLWPNPELGLAVRPGIDGAPSTGIAADLLFELMRPGERGACTSLAEARLASVRARVAADEYAVAAEVRRERVALLAAERTLALHEQESALRDQALDLVRRRQELGEARALDVLLVDLERVEAQRALRSARADRDRLQRELVATLGLPPNAPIRLKESGQPLAFAVGADVSDESLDALVVARRLDLRSLEASYLASEEALRLAVARQFPRVALGPSFEQDAEGTRALGLGLSVELPLFSRHQAEIAEKEAARERARAEYAAGLHQARARAFEARESVRRLRGEVETLRRDVEPIVDRAESQFEAAFRARELTVVEWLAARSRALAARRELLRALVDYAAACAELDAALGAPFTSPPLRDGRSEP